MNCSFPIIYQTSFCKIFIFSNSNLLLMWLSKLSVEDNVPDVSRIIFLKYSGSVFSRLPSLIYIIRLSLLFNRSIRFNCLYFIIIYKNVFTISPLPSTCPSFSITLSSSSESYWLLTFLCSFYFLWEFDLWVSLYHEKFHITNYMSFTSFVNQYLPNSLEQILF